MKSYKLSFGEIIIHDKNLAEVIVNEGVILDLACVAEYHDFLKINLTAPFSLLINKKNQYSYDFNAQRYIADIAGLNKIAALVTSPEASMSTKTLITINRNKNWNIKLFIQRDEALAWLVCSKKEVS